MRRISIALFATLGLVLAATGADAGEASREDTSHATSNIRFIKNIPYPSGSDIEFGEFTVTVLDEFGNPVCESDAEGNCLVDEEGNVIYRTEQRDYAFAGSYQGTRIVDITDPEEAFVAAFIDCRVSQGDIQVRTDLGLLGIGVDSSTPACGMGNSQGVLLFDVSDPRSPEQAGVWKYVRGTGVGTGGAHNLTFHPTAPLMYISDSDVANNELGEMPIVDISDPANPTLVRIVAFHTHSPHDITFNADGTRAYAASINRTDIWNTTDPRNPTLVSSIHDPSVNIHHQADPTPDGKYLIIADELAGAAADPVCPGGGLHFYDITNELAPVPVGVFFADDVGPRALCTAHVFRINPDGKTLTIGWYSAGTRVVDISDPRGAGATEIGHMIATGLGGNTQTANSWASKMYKGHIYSNDRSRGLDILQWMPAVADAPATGRAVVSLIDTGINPYHQEFRWDSPLAFEHPSTYIPGYPEDAIALPVNLDEPDYWKAVKGDCNSIWKTVQNGQLYWFPGTKIIGAASFGASAINCSPTQPSGGRILDSGGHGTMTASRATANTYGACPECLVVAVHDPLSIQIGSSADTGRIISAIKFAANNASWIDMQSNSWGPFVFPGWDPTGAAGLLTANPALVRAVEEVSQAHLAFWASGNGAAGRGGVIGSPTLLTPTLTPSAISVGGHDSGYVNIWPGFPPHLVSDSCSAWAAAYRSTTQSGDTIAGGTSGATPYVAGGAARILLQARSILGDNEETGIGTGGVVASGPAGLVPTGPLADGQLTMAEWREVLFKTATARPARQFEDGPPCTGNALYGPTPVRWQDVPPGYPEYLHIGYGAVDDPALAQAFDVLAGHSPVPDRTVTDAYFTADAAARSVLHQVYRGGPT